MIFYLWIPAIILIAILSAYVGVKSNFSGQWYWSILLWIIWAIPIWPVVVKYSSNLVRDHLLFNMIIVVVMNTVTMYFLKSTGVTFTSTQYIGIGLALIGLLLIQLKI